MPDLVPADERIALRLFDPELRLPDVKIGPYQVLDHVQENRLGCKLVLPFVEQVAIEAQAVP